MHGAATTHLWITPQFADETKILLAWSHVRERFELPQFNGPQLNRKGIWQRLAERAGVDLARALMVNETPNACLDWPPGADAESLSARAQIFAATFADSTDLSTVLRELNWEWVSARDIAIGFTSGGRMIDPAIRMFLELTGRHPVSQLAQDRVLSIGVTGHRDLFSDDVPVLFDKLHQAIEDVQREFPDHQLQVWSSLTEGADQLLADVALEQEIPLWSPLPLPVELYEKDFSSSAALNDFRQTLDRTAGWFCLPPAEGLTRKDLESQKSLRDNHYRRAGRYIVHRSNVLLALWDGHPSNAIGGTADVLRYAIEAPRRPGQQLLIRHVPTRRLRQRGSAY